MLDICARDRILHKEIFINSLKYCQENKGLKLHAWVIMTNLPTGRHVHLIISSDTNKIEHIVRDLKKVQQQTNRSSHSGKSNRKQERVPACRRMDA